MENHIKRFTFILAIAWLLNSVPIFAQNEDAIQAKIRQETEEATATAYTVIFDNSGSMAGARIEKAQKAFRWWLSSVQPGNIWCLLKFNQKDAALAVPFTLNGQDNVAQMIATLRADSSTPIVKTLRKAEEEINKRRLTHPYERHVILVFTDGEENEDPSGNNGVVRKITDLRKKGIEVIGIGYAGAGDYMASVASRYFQADDEAALRKGLSKVEVEIDVMTPVNVTPQELQQMANPQMVKSAASQADQENGGPVHWNPTRQPTKTSNHNTVVALGVGILLLYIVRKVAKRS